MGVVEKVGENVKQFVVGQRVVGISASEGTWCQFVTEPASTLVRISFTPCTSCYW